MGPRPIGRGNLPAYNAMMAEAGELQWGRDQLVAEIDAFARIIEDGVSFNGAATNWSRKWRLWKYSGFKDLGRGLREPKTEGGPRAGAPAAMIAYWGEISRGCMVASGSRDLRAAPALAWISA